MTPIQQHCAKWKNGCGSDQCSNPHTRIVFGRGSIPCDVLFVGEAPGQGENLVGQPFVGEAGQELDSIIEAALEEFLDPTVAFCNLVGCIPLSDGGNKAGEPDAEQILACKPRLEDFLTIAQPRLIVQVGKHAREWLSPGFKSSVKTPDVPMVDIVHPAAILRAPTVQKGMMRQRSIVVIKTAVRKLLGAPRRT